MGEAFQQRTHAWWQSFTRHSRWSETNGDEGHYDRLTGEYHYHRTVASSMGRDIVAIQSQARADAERDVLRDAKSDNTWYGAGFLFGLLGIGAAYVMTPAVERRHGWLVLPAWEFVSEVWEYEHEDDDAIQILREIGHDGQ